MSEVSSRMVLESIAQLVAAKTGLATMRAPEDFARASLRAMERLAIGSWGEFAGKLAIGDGWDALLDEITIGETYFFRNREHFDFVRDSIIPAVLSERPVDHGLRVWSAGCASGEEAYSLAIQLHQLGLLANASVLGTDISIQAIGKAKACRYREWAFRAIDSDTNERYFEGDRSERRVVSEVRDRVQFRQLNLAEVERSSSDDTDNSDLIFCRNVLIYLSREAIEQVGRRLFASLAPGGWLVTGPSDPLLNQAAPFEVITGPGGLCYRRPSDAKSIVWNPAPPVRMQIDSAGPSQSAIGRRQPPPSAAGTARVTWTPTRPIETEGSHAQAHAAFARADYKRVIQIARLHPSDHKLAVLWVRASWNHGDGLLAQRVCADAIRHHSLSAELHYLHAVALLDCRKLSEALVAVQKAVYLDRSLAIAHFTKASILERLHDREGARRAYRNAYELSASAPPNEPVALGDGIVASGMAAAAARAIAALTSRASG